MQKMASRVQALASGTIHTIANDRMADGRQMHSDLVRSSGHRADSQETIPVELFDDFVVCFRRTSGRHHGAALPVAGISPDRGVDDSTHRFKLSVDQGDIFLGHGTASKLLLKVAPCAFGFCRDKEPARL